MAAPGAKQLAAADLPGDANMAALLRRSDRGDDAASEMAGAGADIGKDTGAVTVAIAAFGGASLSPPSTGVSIASASASGVVSPLSSGVAPSAAAAAIAAELAAPPLPPAFPPAFLASIDICCCRNASCSCKKRILSSDDSFGLGAAWAAAEEPLAGARIAMGFDDACLPFRASPGNLYSMGTGGAVAMADWTDCIRCAASCFADAAAVDAWEGQRVGSKKSPSIHQASCSNHMLDEVPSAICTLCFARLVYRVMCFAPHLRSDDADGRVSRNLLRIVRGLALAAHLEPGKELVPRIHVERVHFAMSEPCG